MLPPRLLLARLLLAMLLVWLLLLRQRPLGVARGEACKRGQPESGWSAGGTTTTSRALHSRAQAGSPPLPSSINKGGLITYEPRSLRSYAPQVPAAVWSWPIQ